MGARLPIGCLWNIFELSSNAGGLGSSHQPADNLASRCGAGELLVGSRLREKKAVGAERDAEEGQSVLNREAPCLSVDFSASSQLLAHFDTCSSNMAAPLFHLLLLGTLLCTASSTNAGAIKWVNGSEYPPWTLDTSGLDLQILPPTLHCGQLVVPMDYTKPIGLHNNITLGLAMYRPKSPKGAIFQ